MFVDSVKIHIKAGNGGDGALSWLREKYVSKGGPAGGNGGRGGSVIFVGEEGLTTLIDFKYTRKIEANAGNNGEGKNCFGLKGDDVYVKVPVGTTIINLETNKVVGDITKHGEEIIVAKGGRGGKGNAAFATSRNPSPEISEKGQLGEEFDCQLELKVLADVGLVGFPSVGKSTLISASSKARPKIADYHFTTLSPNLGVVSVGDGRSFIMADLPGLIEGASLGAGLGIQFLKHIERTRVIVHIIDMSGTDGRDPLLDYEIINKELKSYREDLLNRAQIVVANKMDLPSSEENLKRFKEKYDIEILEISAATNEGVQKLIYKIADVLAVEKKKRYLEKANEQVVEYVYQKAEKKFDIVLEEDGVYTLTGSYIEELFKRTNFDSDTNARVFAKKLRDLGVDDKLREMGAKHGDSVSILGYVFEFLD